MKGYSLFLAYHHDYRCLSTALLRLLEAMSPQSEYQRRLERFEAVKQSSPAARFYK
jgi:hypothetical protein